MREKRFEDREVSEKSKGRIVWENFQITQLAHQTAQVQIP